ncbi:hypothetical protein PP175_25765 (plasmid) [Aneurinibacillus sp. Ricciae_BoGa-3]|uniref:hypothetical protein n=1 Tax=Aneurinibacillus sp. Ricciae_BoGa-3 TaxID=3022697 RepID=UPI0023417DC7|nr:hypothetical protein [Aneurinibacillus sp. Ricciae_BoGa-3]WCK57476.1 hypothetical protein PP175_25765 [Aneurinibacillus sp. Ricciae_BoGa-3]
MLSVEDYNMLNVEDYKKYSLEDLFELEGHKVVGTPDEENIFFVLSQGGFVFIQGEQDYEVQEEGERIMLTKRKDRTKRPITKEQLFEFLSIVRTDGTLLAFTLLDDFTFYRLDKQSSRRKR